MCHLWITSNSTLYLCDENQCLRGDQLWEWQLWNHPLCKVFLLTGRSMISLTVEHKIPHFVGIIMITSIKINFTIKYVLITLLTFLFLVPKMQFSDRLCPAYGSVVEEMVFTSPQPPHGSTGWDKLNSYIEGHRKLGKLLLRTEDLSGTYMVLVSFKDTKDNPWNLFLSGGITHEKIDSSIFSGLVEAADKTNSWFITSGIHNVSAF